MKGLRIFFLLILPLPGFSQYIPNSGQNFHYATLYNPAFTGLENFVDIKAGYRYQWTGFKEAAPKFGNISASMRIKHPLDMKLNALRSSRPDYSKIIPNKKLNLQGLGFNAYTEKIGPMESVGAGLHYAYHFHLSDKSHLSAGLGGMVQNTRIDESELYWGPGLDPSDPIYQQVMAGGVRQTELWARTGLLFYTEEFYVGATYYPWNTTIKTSDVAFSDQYYHGGFQIGYSFPLSEDFTLKPSVWGMWMTTGSWAIDYAAKMYMQERTWFGLTYRSVQAGIVSAGFNINHMLSASYCYEFSLGKLRTFSGGSHELVLALRLNNFKKLNQHIW